MWEKGREHDEHVSIFCVFLVYYLEYFESCGLADGSTGPNSTYLYRSVQIPKNPESSI